MSKGTPTSIDFNKIYNSKFDGDYIILEEVEDIYNKTINNNYDNIISINTNKSNTSMQSLNN